MEHTTIRGSGLVARTCDACGDVLTVIFKDDAGQIWTGCPRDPSASATRPTAPLFTTD